MSFKLARRAESYRTLYRTDRAVWTSWTERVSLGFGKKTNVYLGGEIAMNWNSMPTMAFGQSREAGFIIRCKMGNCSLNGETRQKRKELDWKRQIRARNVITRFKSEEQMTLLKKSNHETVVRSQAPIALRVLARLELKKHRLVEELAEVESQRRQLSREIELKEIPIPWLTRPESKPIETGQ